MRRRNGVHEDAWGNVYLYPEGALWIFQSADIYIDMHVLRIEMVQQVGLAAKGNGDLGRINTKRALFGGTLKYRHSATDQ